MISSISLQGPLLHEELAGVEPGAKEGDPGAEEGEPGADLGPYAGVGVETGAEVEGDTVDCLGGRPPFLTMKEDRNIITTRLQTGSGE